MSKLPIILLLSLSFVIVVTMQNCGNFTPQTMALNSSLSNPNDTSAYQDVTPLSCPASSSAPLAQAFTEAEQIAGYGRLSRDPSVAGFITASGRVFSGKLADASSSLVEFDPGTSYKWVDFSYDICGVSTAGVVKCRLQSQPTVTFAVPALEGSSQVAIVNYNSICGLNSDGSVSCVPRATPQAAASRITPPTPVVLMTGFAFIDKNHLSYSALKFLTSDFSSPTQDASVFKRSANTEVSPELSINTCGEQIMAGGIVGSMDYYRATGCLVSDKGALYCVITADDWSGKMKMRTVLADGSMTQEFRSIDPSHAYVAAKVYDRMACAIRANNDVVCFSLGYVSAPAGLMKQAGVQVLTRQPNLIPAPETLQDASLIRTTKGCALRNGSAFCWRRPVIDVVTGDPLPFYEIKSTIQLSSIVGGIAGRIANGATSRFDRACFLRTDGELVCEKDGFSNAVSGELDRMDPGVSYVNFFSEASSSYYPCGLTTDGRVRCLVNSPFITARDQMKTYFTDIVHFTPGMAINSLNQYSTDRPDASEKTVLKFKDITGIVYSKPVLGLNYLFEAASGSIYDTSASGIPRALSPADAAQILKMKQGLVSFYYFDESTKTCAAVQNGKLEAGLRCPHESYLGSGVATSFISTQKQIAISQTGQIFHLDTGENGVGTFMPPQAPPLN